MSSKQHAAAGAQPSAQPGPPARRSQDVDLTAIDASIQAWQQLINVDVPGVYNVLQELVSQLEAL